MIRIDEIYNNTFWPWIHQHRPGTRMFFCDPFGHTRPENLFNHGVDDAPESDYIYFHDQEPVQLTAHRDLFQDVVRRNGDIKLAASGHIIVSERGEKVKELCDIYGWQSHYYFFHGWACLDWFRGYHRTFLFSRPDQRPMPTRTFMSPNRIIGGERDHRCLFIYHVIRKRLAHNHVSAPDVCPVEHTNIQSIAYHYQDVYNDISEVLSEGGLPWLYKGETTQQMTSCWLSNFAEAMDSLIYVPTETVYFGDRTHLTEKTFKAIALGMPFVLVAPAGSLEYLREYGFQTFGDLWDESYDQETDDIRRLEQVTDLLEHIDRMSHKDKQNLWRHCLSRVMHNWNHFYHGGFENILWKELQTMLERLRV